MATTQTPHIVLRYFDARGRVQYLRAFLATRGIAFDDERMPLGADFADWFAIKGERALAGPFQKLPVMQWGERTIAETPIIHAFVHEAAGDQARLSRDENLRHSMLASSLYLDVLQPIGMLIWADRVFPGIDLARYAKTTVERLHGNLATLDRTLDEWRWLETAAERPVMLADCLLWDQLRAARDVLGERLDLAATPRLERWLIEHPQRRAFEAVLEERPSPLTGHPSEAAALVKLREALDAA